MLGKLEMLKVGSDIEVFLRDMVSGHARTSIGLIGGTKEAPRPLKSVLNWKDGYAVQEDNVALEYNIPPASTSLHFAYNIMRAQEAIMQEIAVKGLKMDTSSSMRFSKEQLDHLQAQKAGCEPDYCVWDRKQNEPVALDAEIRGAGAHVHVSFLVDGVKPKFPQYLSEAECLVMALDLTLGIPSISMDKDVDRRRFYGKAGAFRPKPYGIEYRVLGPWWTAEPKYSAWVFEQVLYAFNIVNSWGAQAHAKLLAYRPLVQAAIDTRDETAAFTLARQLNLKTPK